MSSTTSQTSILDQLCRAGLIPAGNDTPMQTGTIGRTDLQPAPLKPGWILSGNPVARSLPLGEAPDGNFSFGLWDCTDGQFNFSYRCDELVHILEGEVTIRAPYMELHLHAGDVAFFPQGLTAHWTVHGYVKKLAIFRSAERSFLTRIASKAKRIWKRVARTRSKSPGFTRPPFAQHAT
jgi:uncharacterized cupin superfamily protein